MAKKRRAHQGNISETATDLIFGPLNGFFKIFVPNASTSLLVVMQYFCLPLRWIESGCEDVYLTATKSFTAMLFFFCLPWYR